MQKVNSNAALGKFNQKYGIPFSDSFLIVSASVINTPIMLIDPVLNRNGIELFDCNICEQGAATPWFSVLAKTSMPQNQNDGDIILAANNATATIAMGDCGHTPYYLDANKGLWLFPIVAATMGSRQGIYRRI